MRLHGLLLLLTVGLAACAGSVTRAPVSDQAKGLREPVAEYREVVAGDTLYSIAWEAGRDYQELAAWNELAPPYTIYPGQKLRLRPSPSGTAKSAATPEPGRKEEADHRERKETKPRDDARYHVVKRGETLYGIARGAGVEPRELAAWNGISPPYMLRIGQRLRLSAPGERPAVASAGPAKAARKDKPEKSAKSQAPKSAPQTAAAASPPRSSTAPIGAWSWPANGALLARFQPGGTNKGLDIGGSRGATIHAAADGQVVYQGGGLRGYGQLIIVKHNADFLSAYAHCDRIYVKEGDVVKGGQKIADMGSSGTDRVKLHFEIRRRGTPVDPLDYLPRK
jgi:lipoprotein NlpD